MKTQAQQIALDNAAAMMQEAIDGLPLKQVCELFFAALCDHPEEDNVALDHLANRIGRIPHARLRAQEPLKFLRHGL